MGKHKKIVTKPSKNKSTESRRAMRVKTLMVAGWSMEKIREELSLSPSMLDYYFEMALDRAEYQKWRYEHDLKHREQKGLEWGSKTEQYYPSDMYSEEESFQAPDYDWDELSEEEKEFYNNFKTDLDNEKRKK